MVAHRLQHRASIGLPVEWPWHDICSHNASLMLAHHLQPWLNSKTALAKHLILAGGGGGGWGAQATLYTDTCYFNVGTVL